MTCSCGAIAQYASDDESRAWCAVCMAREVAEASDAARCDLRGAAAEVDGARMTEYDCMTAAELAEWRAAALQASKRFGYIVTIPCTDCPAYFRLAELAAGRCNRPARYRRGSAA